MRGIRSLAFGALRARVDVGAIARARLGWNDGGARMPPSTALP